MKEYYYTRFTRPIYYYVLVDINMLSHYVYRITNTRLGRHYYGVRTAKNWVLPENDIGVGYFSSSKDKEFRKDQKTNPGDYKYKIISVFRTREEATYLEVFLHEKFDVAMNQKFYNRAKQTSTGFSNAGVILAQSTKDKMIASHKNRSPEDKAATAAQTKETRDGKSPEEKAAISDKMVASHKNRSIEDKAVTASLARGTWENKSIEELTAFSTQISTIQLSRPSWLKRLIGSRISKGHKNRSPEDKAATAAQTKETRDGKSPEEKAAISDKMVASHKNRSIEDKAVTASKLSDNSSGAKNRSAINIWIYDASHELQFTCHGTFKEVCDDNNLPRAFFRRCYVDNLPGFSKSNRANEHSYFEKFSHCEGWYARRFESNEDAYLSQMSTPRKKKIIYHIYDSSDKIRFSAARGEFDGICSEYSLPRSFLMRSYRDNLTGFEKGGSKRGHKYFEKYRHYEGWYARKI